jgi:signal transduction histidine kinase
MRESDFLSIASHELRTPITVIVGLAATLAERRREMSEEQIDASIEQIRRQGERLAVLVADLLDLSQLEAGRTHAVVEPVLALAGAQLSLAAPPPPLTKSVELGIPDDLWVLPDSGRLEQVLVNLLTNAYRYGGDTVEVHARRRVDEGTLVTVADSGQGVPGRARPGPIREAQRLARVRGKTAARVSGSRSSERWSRRSAVASVTTSLRGTAPASTSSCVRRGPK